MQLVRRDLSPCHMHCVLQMQVFVVNCSLNTPVLHIKIITHFMPCRRKKSCLVAMKVYVCYYCRTINLII